MHLYSFKDANITCSGAGRRWRPTSWGSSHPIVDKNCRTPWQVGVDWWKNRRVEKSDVRCSEKWNVWPHGINISWMKVRVIWPPQIFFLSTFLNVLGSGPCKRTCDPKWQFVPKSPILKSLLVTSIESMKVSSTCMLLSQSPVYTWMIQWARSIRQGRACARGEIPLDSSCMPRKALWMRENLWMPSFNAKCTHSS